MLFLFHSMLANLHAAHLTVAHAFISGHYQTSVVKSFNNGFDDAKRDDCQQGFKAACMWLNHSK